jgi:hypothetical protein
MWWIELFRGFWNGLTAWVVLLVHVFGGWADSPLYNAARTGNWEDGAARAGRPRVTFTIVDDILEQSGTIAS